MTFRAKFLLVCFDLRPPNNPITACGATSFPGYHSFPKWAIPTQPQESSQISTNVPTGDAATAPNPVQEPSEIIPATPFQAPTQVTTPQALSTMANTSSISPPSLPLSILTPPPTVEILSPVRKRKRPQSVKFVNYLDPEPKRASRRSRRLHRTSPYKYSQYDKD